MAQPTIGQRVSALEKTVQDLATRQELHAVRDDLRAELHEMRDHLTALIEQRTVQILTTGAARDEETRRYMRVLHEDVIERIERLHG